MNDEIKNKYQYYFTYDYPVPYENKLLIYPLIVKDYMIFFSCVDCLMIDKNSIPDIKVIKMSYLDYLFYKSEQEPNKITLSKLFEILRLCFKLNENELMINTFENGKHELVIKNQVINGTDFEEIRKIICYQNNVELPDESIASDLKKALEEAQEFYNQQNNAGKVGSLEDQIDCIVSRTSYKHEEIYNLTIRRFIRLLERVDTTLHYVIYKTAEMGGMVKFKEPVESWRNSLDKSFEEKYKHLMVDPEAFKKKVNMENNQ